MRCCGILTLHDGHFGLCHQSYNDMSLIHQKAVKLERKHWFSISIVPNVGLVLSVITVPADGKASEGVQITFFSKFIIISLLSMTYLWLKWPVISPLVPCRFEGLENIPSLDGCPLGNGSLQKRALWSLFCHSIKGKFVISVWEVIASLSYYKGK